MNPTHHNSFIHSPNSYNYSQNNGSTINDITIIKELLNAKEEVITTQKELIQQLKASIEKESTI